VSILSLNSREDFVIIGYRRSVLLFVAGSIMSAAGIDTITPWNGTQFESPFGVTNTATYGQTITVAAGTGNLTSFSFELSCTVATALRGEVYAWNGTQATGPNLFESGVTTVPAIAGVVYQLITFNTGAGGIALSTGNYVLFVSTSKDQTGALTSACRMGTTPTATYPAGKFVFLNNGTAVAQWTANTWSFTAENAAFQANFNNLPGTPAPGTLTLVALGAIALGLFSLRSLPGSRSFPYRDRADT
jgi:hypothetical protein